MKFKTYLSGLATAFMISFLLDANASVDKKPINSVSSKSVEGWYFRAISGYPAAITF